MRLVVELFLVSKYNDAEHAIAYASKTFNHAESKKAPIDLESIVIHWSIIYFKLYLYDTNFLAKSDHKPLVHLYSLTDPTSRLTRMRLDLEEYDFAVERIKGKHNVCVEAFSRITFKNTKETAETEFKNRNILIVTRSMLRSKNNKKLRKDNESIIQSTGIIEATNYKEYKRAPIICVKMEENLTGPNSNSNNSNVNIITKIFSSKNKRKHISMFNIPLNDLDYAIWVKCLQSEAIKLGKNQLTINKDD